MKTTSVQRHSTLSDSVRAVALAWVLLCWWGNALAAPAALTPAQVVQTAISDVLNDLRSDEGLYQEHPAKIYQLVKQKVVPHFDFPRMTQLAMATYWSTASGEQRKATVAAFENLFVYTYGKQFFDYRNTDANIESMPGATDKKAMLKLKVHNQQNNTVNLFLRLEQRDQIWRIIDVNLDGVSYLVTSRGQFSEIISQKGVDGLIADLQESARQKAL